MNYKDLIISAIKGESMKSVPFVPRLDIWYKANKHNSTLPDKYMNATLMEITDDMGIGYHAVVPDFRDYEGDNDDIDLGLGIIRARTLPYTIELHNVERKVERFGGLTKVEYVTPYGSITTAVLYNEAMQKSGATLAHVSEHAVKGVKDFKAIGYIFENIEVKPRYENYLRYKEYIGDRGATIAFSSLSGSPMHYIMRELMPLDTFFYESYDYPDEMAELAEKVELFYHKLFLVTADCPAEIILSGANYDSTIQSPPFFREHIMPALKKQSQILHEKDKFLLTHTDGENKGLLDLYLESGFDIADSMCPAPMTSLSLKQMREVFEDKITIWGGIPSISVLESTMSDYEFEKYLDMTIESVGSGSNIIFSIADTTPPDAKFERIKRIAERVR